MKRRHLLAAAGALSAGAAPSLAHAAPGPGEKVLRLAFPAAETSFDPTQTDSSLYSATVIAHLFEAPLQFDYLARPAKLLPRTALALPDVSADFRTITVRLKPGIHFADDPAFKGSARELVAQDYVYAVKRFYDPRYNSSDLFVFQNVKLLGLEGLRDKALKARQPFDYDSEVEGARALDRYTLQLKLGEPDPRFVWRLADSSLFGAVAREVVEHYGADIGAHPVGTGPFRLKSWRRASRIELERAPQFRGWVYEGQPADDPQAQAIARRLAGKRLPLADRVVVDIIDEDQPRWLAFLNAEHDLLQILPGVFAPLAAPNGKRAPFLAKQGIELQSSLQADIDFNFFNMEDPLVGGYTPEKVALRRAVGLAHDGPTYVRMVRGGFALPAQSTVPPSTSGYDLGYRSEMSEYSPARARALLELYGYVDRNGDGWREQPDGQPLTLRFASMSDQRSRQQAELWKRSLDAVGLAARFEFATWPELLKKARAGALQIWGYGWSANTPDGGFFLGMGYGPNAAESNDSRFALPAFDRLFERQNRLPDGPERDALMRQAKDMLVAYMPYKVHVHRVVVDLTQPWTKNYWRHPFMRDLWSYVDLDAGP